MRSSSDILKRRVIGSHFHSKRRAERFNYSMATRRQFSPDFKAKAAVEAIKGHRTLNEIASSLEIHPIQLSAWKRAALGP